MVIMLVLNIKILQLQERLAVNIASLKARCDKGYTLTYLCIIICLLPGESRDSVPLQRSPTNVHMVHYYYCCYYYMQVCAILNCFMLT
jgi:hypothetical protein